MARTLGDLATEALHDDFDATKYGTRARQAINDALSEVNRHVELPAAQRQTTIAVAAGTAAYTLPADVARLRSIAFERRLLDELTPAALDEISTTARGTPTGYVVLGSDLTLLPTPNVAGTLTLRYRQDLAAIAADGTDVGTIIPEDYAWILVAYARARLFSLEDDQEMSNFWQARWLEGLGKLRGDVQLRVDTGVRQVGDRRRPTRPRFARP